MRFQLYNRNLIIIFVHIFLLSEDKKDKKHDHEHGHDKEKGRYYIKVMHKYDWYFKFSSIM